jgi:predicted phage-related endonuclease
MLCAGWKKAYIVALLGGWRLREEVFVVERNDRIIEAIVKRGEQFWKQHVETGIPPAQSEPGDVELFKRIVRVPEKKAEVPADLIEEWDTAKKAAKAKDDEVKALFAKILLHLKDAEGADMPDGRMLTYFEQNGQRKTDFDALKKKYPDAYAETVTQPRHRFARITKGE